MSTPAPALTPEFALGLREAMLQGLANEMEITKKVLSAVLDDKREFRLDPHGRTAWELAWHIASTDVQMLDETADRKFSMDPRFKDEPKNIAEMVSWYDSNMKRAIDRVRAMTPQELLTPVEFFGAFNFPAVCYLAFVNNHSIHHRGQLSAYLRPMGSKVPSIYGGSYDEPWQPAEAETAA